jgi:poly-gamma-glutamate synthesis protein (capsule biosynthesis protein)
MQSIRPKHTMRSAWIIAAIIVAAALLFGLFQLFGMGTRQAAQSETPSHVESSKPKHIVSLESKLLFTGNSFWGRYTNDEAKKTDKPYEFPFSRLHEFDRKSYDAWITGLECPTTEKGKAMTSADMEATLAFNCDPAYLPNFAKWFDVVTLANNHTDNQGPDGFAETKRALDKNGIQYFGHYNPEQLDDICDVISMPVHAKWSDDSTTEEHLPIAMCGYHGVFQIPSAASLGRVSAYAQYMPVVAMPHSGKEYVTGPDEIKSTMDHTLIDNGADMVIGDHPHWVQSTEAYHGKLIVYSMGNFMFDQQFNPEVVRSAAIQVTLRDTGDESDSLAKWLDLGATCSAFGDDCLAKAKEQGLKKLALSYTFGVIATDDTGYATHPASAQVQQSVEQRMNWQQTLRNLGQS